jgi:hypothetical protein
MNKTIGEIIRDAANAVDAGDIKYASTLLRQAQNHMHPGSLEVVQNAIDNAIDAASRAVDAVWGLRRIVGDPPAAQAGNGRMARVAFEDLVYEAAIALHRNEAEKAVRCFQQAKMHVQHVHPSAAAWLTMATAAARHLVDAEWGAAAMTCRLRNFDSGVAKN